MSLQYTPYAIPLFITTVITFALLIVGTRRQHIPAARIFILFCSVVIIWSAGYALELMAVGLEAKLFWACVQYIGLSSPVAFILFTRLYLGIDANVHWQTFTVLMIMPLIANLAAWTNPQHHLLWTSVALDATAPGLRLGHGPIFYGIVAYSYLLLLMGVYHSWHASQSPSYVRRRQGAILLWAVVAPWLGNLLYVLKLTPSGLDLTPINFGISSIFLGLGLLRYHFLDVTPIARNQVVEKLPDSVIVVDNLGRVVDINPAAADLLGQSSRAAVARPAHELLYDLPGLASQLETPHSIDLMTQFTVDSDERVFNASISVLKDDNAQIQGRVVMLHDVTQQERDAQALRTSETKLRVMVQQLQELDELKTRFMRNINHELRTPLTNIILYIDLLRSGNHENFERNLNVLDKESATLRRLIEQTLDLERVDQMVDPPSLQLSRMNLNLLVGTVTKSAAKVAAKSKIDISAYIPETPVIVEADEERLGIAIINLLTNAVTYTASGGNIRVELTETDPNEAAPYARIKVTDTGMGISVADQEHIFERFYRGEKAAAGNIPGLGIGLSIAKINVEQHGGHIHVHSTVGQGSAFTICLPYKADVPYKPDVKVIIS